MTGLGLGPGDDPALADDLLRLDEHRQPAVLEVDVAAAETEQLAGAQPDEAGDDDKRPKRRGDGVAEADDELGIDHRPLVGVLGAAATDAARVCDRSARRQRRC